MATREIEDVNTQSKATEQEFDISGTVAWITKMQLRKVALQLPDDMLPRAALLVRLLRRNLGALSSRPDLFVLADSSVSAWDPDVVAAQHVGADGLVMYGRASVCKTSAFPVRHVFGNMPLNTDKLASEIARSVPPDHRLIILPHGMYGNHLDAICAAVNAVHPTAFFGRLEAENGPAIPRMPDGSCCNDGVVDVCRSGCQNGYLACAQYQTAADFCAGDFKEARDEGTACSTLETGGGGMRSAGAVFEAYPPFRLGNFVVDGWNRDSEEGSERKAESDSKSPTVVVYIGDEGAELTRLMLENAPFRFLLFSPKAGSDGEGGAIVPEDSLIDSSRALKRRYYLMMKAKDAERIGIVVATTAVEGYRAMVERLTAVVRRACKRPYVFYVGKINPAKLANFAEMDVLVLVASPETCAAVDAAEYWKPLITPFECEVALVEGRSWTGRYDLDFRPLLGTALPAPRDHACGAADSDEEAGASHSLTTGTVTARAAGGLTVLSAGEVMMAQRSFTGLDVKEGLDRPLDLVQGRVGIASGYSHEPSATNSQLSHTQVTDGVRVPGHMEGHASAVNYRVELHGAERPVTRTQAYEKEGKQASERERRNASETDDGGSTWGPGCQVQTSIPMDREVSRGQNDEADMQRVAQDVDDFFALLAS